MLHVIVINTYPPLNIPDVQRILDRGAGWYRVAANSWIVRSKPEQSAEFWQEALAPLRAKADCVFIGRLDPSERSGWHPKKFWDWYDGKTEA